MPFNFVAPCTTVCNIRARDATLKIGLFCPHVLHEFKSAEFHATSCGDKVFDMHQNPIVHVPATYNANIMHRFGYY